VQRTAEGVKIGCRSPLSRGQNCTPNNSLIDEQFAIGLGAAGTRVAERPSPSSTPNWLPEAPPLPDLFHDFGTVPLAFQMGVPSQDAFPFKLWSRILTREARRAAAAPVGYPDPRGDPDLRNDVAAYTSTAPSIPQAISGAYSPSKAGALMLGRLAAVEWGKRGVRSNVVSPGAMLTPMTKPFRDDPVMRERHAAMIASGRISDAHEVANVIAFLLSDLSSYVTGAHIDADGGLRQMMLSLIPRKGVNT
jgi:hypothetical protein